MAKSHDIIYLDNLRITVTLAVVLLRMSSVCLNRFYSPDATVTVSSALPGHGADKANDEQVETWWAAIFTLP